MIKARDSNILTINSGSSSIKFALYVLGETERLELRGEFPGHFQARRSRHRPGLEDQ
jgi:acetate kinase